MTLWRLELLRMVRTHRWTVLVGLYVFFGILGPITGRYLGELMSRFAGDIVFEVPDPRPVDGLVQFVSNTSQLGILGVVIVAASALAIDARVEVAAFLRTRVDHARQLLWPRYAVVASTAVLALVLGTGVAWVGTVALLGGLPAGAMLIGTVYGALYLAFAVAVLAVVGAFARGTLPTVFAGLAALLVLPLIGALPPIQPWLPSHLVGAIVALIEGAPASDYLRAAAVTVVVTPLALVVAAHRLGQREL